MAVTQGECLEWALTNLGPGGSTREENGQKEVGFIKGGDWPPNFIVAGAGDTWRLALKDAKEKFEKAKNPTNN